MADTPAEDAPEPRKPSKEEQLGYHSGVHDPELTPEQKGEVDVLDLDPWERQPGETDAQFLAFVAYRDAEKPRTLRKAAAALRKSIRVMEKHSAMCAWPMRCAAYDRHLDAISRRENEARNKGIEKRQQQHLSAAANALAQPVVAFLTRIQEFQKKNPGEDPFKQFTLDQLQRMAMESIRYMPIVVQAERLVAGLSIDPAGAGAGDFTVDDARRKAESMSRPELQQFLLGEEYNDGRAAQLEAAGVDPANPV